MEQRRHLNEVKQKKEFSQTKHLFVLSDNAATQFTCKNPKGERHWLVGHNPQQSPTLETSVAGSNQK